ncbi:hypothetical protein EDB83DRAFT_2353204 [Lactarius deliciosus]|nr:hypothetical protein EDB83DRAFT_2353204 [Lactarius deliciosus]
MSLRFPRVPPFYLRDTITGYGFTTLALSSSNHFLGQRGTFNSLKPDYAAIELMQLHTSHRAYVPHSGYYPIIRSIIPDLQADFNLAVRNDGHDDSSFDGSTGDKTKHYCNSIRWHNWQRFYPFTLYSKTEWFETEAIAHPSLTTVAPPHLSNVRARSDSDFFRVGEASPGATRFPSCRTLVGLGWGSSCAGFALAPCARTSFRSTTSIEIGMRMRIETLLSTEARPRALWEFVSVLKLDFAVM